MERIGGDVRRELSRFGPQAELGDACRRVARGRGERSPATRGRRASRATGRCIVHTPRRRPGRSSSRSSSRESASARRPRPPTVRFVPGPLPEPAEPASPAEATRRTPADPRRRTRAAAAELAAPIDDESLRETGRTSRRGEPVGGPVRPLVLIHFRRPANQGFAGLFLMAEATYTAKDITVLEGLEPVRKRPGHVHRLHRRARPAPPRLRGRRQRRRRGAGGPQRPRRGDAPSRQLGHGSRLGLAGSRST